MKILYFCAIEMLSCFVLRKSFMKIGSLKRAFQNSYIMKERLFRFKKFAVAHSRSAMKVGVDGVLIGAWATSCDGRILDVGCGCGLIALMMAQRSESALITGIDIHDDSVKEARDNVMMSPWRERIEITHADFLDFIKNNDKQEGIFDLIISNPPFYNSGVTNPLTPREQARHQGSLTPLLLITNGVKILSSNGRISMIVPSIEEAIVSKAGEKNGLSLLRKCYVRDHAGAPVKRVMLEYRVGETDSEVNELSVKVEELVMFDENKEPTSEYRDLCKGFYLKF